MKFTPVCCGGISLRRGVREKVNAMKIDEEEQESVVKVKGGGGQGERCSGEGGHGTEGDVE